MSYGGASHGGAPHGDGGYAAVVSLSPYTIAHTDWEVFVEVGLRGGWVVDVPGDWDVTATYTVALRQLGVTRAALGLVGKGSVCRPRTSLLLPCVTPPLTPGLWRVRVTDLASGHVLVIPDMLRAMRDDLPWHTFELRRGSPANVYRGMGPRRLRDDR